MSAGLCFLCTQTKSIVGSESTLLEHTLLPTKLLPALLLLLLRVSKKNNPSSPGWRLQHDNTILVENKILKCVARNTCFQKKTAQFYKSEAGILI